MRSLIVCALLGALTALRDRYGFTSGNTLHPGRYARSTIPPWRGEIATSLNTSTQHSPPLTSSAAGLLVADARLRVSAPCHCICATLRSLLVSVNGPAAPIGSGRRSRRLHTQLQAGLHTSRACHRRGVGGHCLKDHRLWLLRKLRWRSAPRAGARQGAVQRPAPS